MLLQQRNISLVNRTEQVANTFKILSFYLKTFKSKILYMQQLPNSLITQAKNIPNAVSKLINIAAIFSYGTQACRTINITHRLV